MYHFPINIDGRRLHYFKLSPTEPQILFSYIIKVTKGSGDAKLLSVDYSNPNLISDQGYEHNVDLNNFVFRVEEKEEQIDGLPIYVAHIESKTKKEDNPDNTKKEDNPATGRLLKSAGFLGTEDRNDFATIKIDGTKDIPEAIALVVSYRDENGVEYKDAIKVCFCQNEEKQLFTAALDFGSESSQIRFVKMDENVALVDSFLKFCKDGNSLEIKKDEEQSYWQGKKGDKWYKSLFYIHKKPQPTLKGDEPLVGVEDAFILPLLKTDTADEKYNNLILLPNLKLLELGDLDLSTAEIILENTDFDLTPLDRNLTSQGMRDVVLRIILCNFLHCALKTICPGNEDSAKSSFLRLIVLVPNVYYQIKISKIVSGLYEDFSIIQKKGTYPSCKGLEVQIISESDASFFGEKKRNQTNGMEGEGEHFLIIDAGKGTTDFSILRQDSNYDKLGSIYRDGIPASGNVLTYAFYESLANFINLEIGGKRLDEMVKGADKSTLILFMDKLELIKKKYKPDGRKLVPYIIHDGKNEKVDFKELGDVNTYLDNQFENGNYYIPDCEIFINKKVEQLCRLIKESLGAFIQERNIKITQVFLSGRGFLYRPFKDAVVKMIKEEGVLKYQNADASIIWNHNEDTAKSNCVDGAVFACVTGQSVNFNSGLIGSPSITNVNGRNNFWRRLKQMLPKKIRWIDHAKSSSLGMEFFYKGVGLTAQNAQISIGRRVYRNNGNERELKTILFLGDAFYCQTNNDLRMINEREEFTYVNSEEITGLIKQSLFPFYAGSIVSLENLADVEKTKKTQGEEPSKVTDPLSNTGEDKANE